MSRVLPLLSLLATCAICAAQSTREDSASKPAKSRSEAQLRQAAKTWFEASTEARLSLVFKESLESILAVNPQKTRELVWEAYKDAAIHDELRKDFDAERVRVGKHESPYTLKTVGKKPKGGWPLFIAMHGGGGVSKRVNDSQWRHMQGYYKDQEQLEGYLYLALRAPNDSWNGFYTHYVWPLVSRLIRQFLVLGEVHPDRVFLLGYSHGGYGAFAIGANIPDRFAAIHSSAAAPTPGISPAENLRNTRFSFMIGEKDTRYGRLERCKAFAKEIDALRGERKDIFNVRFELMKGHGHGGLPDRNKIADMYPALRNAVPRELSWQTTGSVVHDFYWLTLPKPTAGLLIEASCRGNTVKIRIKKGKASAIVINLDARLVDFAKPIVWEINGKRTVRRLKPRLSTLCESILSRGDPTLAATARTKFDLDG